MIALLLVATSSCSSDSKKSSSTMSASAAAGQPQPADQGATALTAGAATATTQPATQRSNQPATQPATQSVALAGGGNGAGTSVASASFGAALAITSGVTVQVADVRAAVNQLPALVEARGAAIFDSTISVGDPATATATVTVKVRPTDTEELIAGLGGPGGLGELTARSQQTQDVTDQLTDTASRIATAQKSVERVRALLDTATDLDAVIHIEGELTIRETALEQLLATQRNVTERVQLATLTIVLSPTPPAPVLARHRGKTSVRSALRSGWHGFVVAAHGLAVGAAYIAPLLALVLLGCLVALITRRFRRRQQTGPGQAVSGAL